MFNAITEIFLNEFYMYESVALPLLPCGTEELFDTMYAAFLLPESERLALYSLTERDEVKNVKTRSDYLRFRRVNVYGELVGAERSEREPELDALLVVKGEALKTVAELKLTPTAGQTPFTAYKKLSECANNGSLVAMRILGYLQRSGVTRVGGADSGVKNLLRAAQWNCIEGMLLSMYFDEDCREDNINRLYTVAKNTPYEELIQLAQNAYGIKTAAVAQENKLLIKAFGACVLKPDVYSVQHARFIFSKVLSIRDKEQLLFSDSREAVSETADLPLKLTYGFPVTDDVDRSGFGSARTEELDKVILRAMSGDLRTERSYRPLCVCSESDYLRKRYADVIAAVYKDAHIEYIDVAALSDYDFEPTKNNIFVRSCDEDAANVYLLTFVGEINPAIFDRVKTFLLSSGRRRFRLTRPCVDIDLSPVLPVCLCDKHNAKAIKHLCDVINVAPIEGEEKLGVLERIIDGMHKKYKGIKINIQGEAMRLLSELSVDRAKSRLEKIIRFNRKKKSDINITPEMVIDDSGERDTVAYGFGGRNEN